MPETLSKKQHSILVGTLLGDANLNSMTLALTKKEYGLIADWFRYFLPVVRCKQTNSNCVVLKFGVDGSEILAGKIAKYLPPSMRYKIRDVKLEVPHS